MTDIKLTIEGKTTAEELAQTLRDLADTVETYLTNEEYVDNDLVINLDVTHK